MLVSPSWACRDKPSLLTPEQSAFTSKVTALRTGSREKWWWPLLLPYLLWRKRLRHILSPHIKCGCQKNYSTQIQWFSTTEVLLLPARGVSIVLKWGEDGWYHTEDWEVVQRMQWPCFSSRVSPGYVAKGQLSNGFKRRWGGLWGSPMQGQKFQLHSLMQLCQISAYST